MIEVDWHTRTVVEDIQPGLADSVREFLPVALEKLRIGGESSPHSRNAYILVRKVERIYFLSEQTGSDPQFLRAHPHSLALVIEGIQLQSGRAVGHLVGFVIPIDLAKLTPENLWHLRGVHPAEIVRLRNELRGGEFISREAVDEAVRPLLQARQYPRLLHRRR